MDAHVSDPGPSLWEATTTASAFPGLEGRVEVDAAVVGAGITGVTAAYLLKQAGKRVALVEGGRIGQGTTGRTTAKLTVGHGLVYSELAADRGRDAARQYAEANRSAIVELEAIVSRHGIDCDWEPAANYVHLAPIFAPLSKPIEPTLCHGRVARASPSSMMVTAVASASSNGAFSVSRVTRLAVALRH